jgi:hypothetical protein
MSDLRGKLEDLRLVLTSMSNAWCEDSLSDILKIDGFVASLAINMNKIIAVGEFSSGKSSLLNALLGTDVLPMADLPMTGTPIEIQHSETPYIGIVVARDFTVLFRTILFELISGVPKLRPEPEKSSMT